MKILNDKIKRNKVADIGDVIVTYKNVSLHEYYLVCATVNPKNVHLLKLSNSALAGELDKKQLENFLVGETLYNNIIVAIVDSNDISMGIPFKKKEE